MSVNESNIPDIKIDTTYDHEDDTKRVTNKMIQRAQWLRAAILGANDGLLSTTSLMLGVGAAKDHDQRLMVISGVAGALAGACSMAVGEFVSVSTQRDIEHNATIEKCVDLKDKEISVNNNVTDDGIKRQEYSTPRVSSNSPATHLARSPYMKVLASDYSQELPNPYKAACASAVAFLFGSLVPLLAAIVCSQSSKVRVVAIIVVTSIALIVFGAGGARLGGSPVRVSAMRVLVGGWIAMGVTYGLLKPLDRDDHNGHDTDQLGCNI